MCVDAQIEKYVRKLQELEALFDTMGGSGVDESSGLQEAISTAEEMVTSLENKANNLIGNGLFRFLLAIYICYKVLYKLGGS